MCIKYTKDSFQWRIHSALTSSGEEAATVVPKVVVIVVVSITDYLQLLAL